MPDDTNFVVWPMITLEGLKPLPSARKFLTRLMSIWCRKNGWVLGVCACVWGACGFACTKSRSFFSISMKRLKRPVPRKTLGNMAHLASIKSNNWDCEALGQ